MGGWNSSRWETNSGRSDPRHSTVNRQGCDGTNGEREDLTGALRETSVLGLRPAGTRSVTLVIEDENKDAVKSEVCCSERGWR